MASCARGCSPSTCAARGSSWSTAARCGWTWPSASHASSRGGRCAYAFRPTTAMGAARTRSSEGSGSGGSPATFCPGRRRVTWAAAGSAASAAARAAAARSCRGMPRTRLIVFAPNCLRSRFQHYREDERADAPAIPDGTNCARPHRPGQGLLRRPGGSPRLSAPRASLPARKEVPAECLRETKTRRRHCRFSTDPSLSTPRPPDLSLASAFAAKE